MHQNSTSSLLQGIDQVSADRDRIDLHSLDCQARLATECDGLHCLPIGTLAWMMLILAVSTGCSHFGHLPCIALSSRAAGPCYACSARACCGGMGMSGCRSGPTPKSALPWLRPLGEAERPARRPRAC